MTAPLSCLSSTGKNVIWLLSGSARPFLSPPSLLSLTSPSALPHLVLAVLAATPCREDEGSFNVAVCNWGPGIDRHPARLHAATGSAQRTPAIDLRCVPRERIIDSSFWFVLLRMIFLPASAPRGPPLLYDTLLPALTDMPALSHAATRPTDELRWHDPPLSGDVSHAALAMTAIEAMLCARGFSSSQAACERARAPALARAARAHTALAPLAVCPVFARACTPRCIPFPYTTRPFTPPLHHQIYWC